VPEATTAFNKLSTAITIGTFAGFFILWELVSKSGMFNANLFPPPSVILGAFLESFADGEFKRDVSASIFRVGMGFMLGSILGISLGLMTGRVYLFRVTIGQLLNFLRNIPSIAFVPLAIVWLGISEASKIFLVVWGVIFPVWINTHQGAAQINEQYLWAIRSLGANRMQAIKEVVLPSTLPFVVVGLRMGIALAFITLVAAEIAGAFYGIGYRISSSHLIFRVDKMLLGIVTLGLLGFFADKLYVFAIKKTLPWIEIR